MKPTAALSKASYVSILGALGQGAAGDTTNVLAQVPAAPVAAGTSARWDSSAFVSKTGRVLIIVQMTLSKNSGTLAAGDVVAFDISKDGGGFIGPDSRATAATNGSDVVAFGALSWIDTVTPGVSHTYGIVASITGGHTGGILTGEACVTLVDV